MTAFHPELERLARFLPRFSFGPRVVWLIRRLTFAMRPPPLPHGVTVEALEVPGPEGAPPIQVRVYRPSALKAPAPAMLWIHGGGFVIGHPLQDEATSAGTALALGIVVVAVRYRLAPEHPFPAPLEDCYAALRWLHSNAASLGVRPDRIALGGASAGGGLAAGLALVARDRGEVKPAFQLLVYPMIDDRTATRSDIDERHVRVWTADSNRYGWRSYLGQDPGGRDAPIYAAPARAADLTGLAPAWIGVGTVDLFHDEDVAYAARLNAQGISCELVTVPGAYHGFDALSPKTGVARGFLESQRAALQRALFPEKV